MSSIVLCEKETELASEIEEMRSEMVELGRRFGLQHPEVQKRSEQLDLLLNRYYHLQRT
jgi:hypothetical protein